MTKDPFTHQVIALAMQTHPALGPGLHEDCYHRELHERLTRTGIEHLFKPRHELIYRGFVADIFEADVVFEERLVAELKVVRGSFAPEHFTQLLSYNKFWRTRTGMLFAFDKASLMQKRVVYDSRTATMPETSMPSFVSNPSLANQLRDIASQCLRDIGLGYRESTWIGLMTAALRAEGIPFVVNPVTTIPSCGDTTLRCLVINGQCAITITALGHEITATDRAKAQTCLRWLGLPWGLAFHFGKEAVDLKFVSAPR